MSETFTKLFGSLTDSTVWAEDNETRILWITMLAMADRHGYVGASIPGLAARARVPVEAVESALAKFLAPDRYSRSQEYDGRRIEVADRGWNLLNYARFRDMRDEEARKEYERHRKREQRARQVPERPGHVRDVPDCPAVSAQAEAEAEADASTTAGDDDVTGVTPSNARRTRGEVQGADLAVRPNLHASECHLCHQRVGPGAGFLDGKSNGKALIRHRVCPPSDGDGGECAMCHRPLGGTYTEHWRGRLCTPCLVSPEASKDP